MAQDRKAKTNETNRLGRSKMKLSIVTISFNQAKYLERTILSVINQKGVDVEYIVVDPGSTDGSRDIIERYRHRITRILFDKDAGPADGLNRGFDVATGDWFGYINSDDYYLPESLRLAAAAAQRNHNAGAIVGNGYIVDSDDRTVRRQVSTRYTVMGALYGACFSLQQATFYRQKPFREAQGFNAKNRTCWDREILVEIAKRGYRISRFYEDIGAFRIHSESITGSGRLSELYLKDMQDIFQAATGRRQNLLDRGIFGPALRAFSKITDPARAVDSALDRVARRNRRSK